MRTMTPEDYTVGWICALPVELTASLAMFDETHRTLSAQNPADFNSYNLGRIGNHNVVMACLPAGRIGLSSAAAIATQMQFSFTALKFGLMVGIGGGVPHASKKSDIRLGDVVVSIPSGRTGGVLQYDFGKSLAEGVFKVTATLNAPPTVLLTAITTLRSRDEISGSELTQYLSQIPPHLRAKYDSPGPEKDTLFLANYSHVKSDEACAFCDKTMTIQRPPRQSTEPMIHYGTIASGNSVMVNAVTRDKLAKELGVLCFEMEAAGLMNTFPCVVIRGICDYCDSHKNGIWKPYASAMAATYAKRLLNIIPELTIHPRTATLLPSTFHTFNYRLLPLTSIPLGRLLIDPRTPWDNFCQRSPTLSASDIEISCQPRLREVIESISGLRDKLRTLFGGSPHPLESIISVPQKTHTLYGAANHFADLRSQNDVRFWFETVIKQRWNAYMVVALHTIMESSIYVPNNRTEDNDRELILAIQYRKVQFRRYNSLDLNETTLGLNNRWKVIQLKGRGLEEGKNDIIEANLQDVMRNDDIQGDIYFTKDYMIVL